MILKRLYHHLHFFSQRDIPSRLTHLLAINTSFDAREVYSPRPLVEMRRFSSHTYSHNPFPMLQYNGEKEDGVLCC